jgi:hypothetical protein
MSTSSKRRAASKTGEILPSEIGIAALMNDRTLQKPCRVGMNNRFEG